MSSASPKARFGEYRIYVLALIILVFSGVLTNGFFSTENIRSILDNQACLIITAIGFTIVLITRELDLSIGSVLTFGMISFTYHANHQGIATALILTCLYGALFGLFNGILVAKLKVDSFIATLASMIMVDSLAKIVTRSETYSLDRHRFESLMDLLESPLLGISGGYVSTLAALVITIVILATLLLSFTRPGRNMYLIGANEKTAWYSGVPVECYKICAFVFCGIMASLGGAVYVLKAGSVNFDEGSGSLMTIIAGVIVGGTSMQGGKGSVFQSFIAIFSLAALIKMFNLLGAESEVIMITNGVVLGSVILYDAYLSYRKRLFKGQRHELLAELEDPHLRAQIFNPNTEQEEGDNMQKNNSLTIVCVTAIACTAIVAMMTLSMNKDREITINLPQGYAAGASPASTTQAAVTTSPGDPFALTSVDGQALLPREIIAKEVPAKVEGYENLPETDPARWYDYEYGMHTISPLDDLPVSPGTGPVGKKVVLLKFIDHPYLTALENGAVKAAEAYGIELKVLSAQYKHSIQAQQVAQVITERPDLVIIQPVNAQSSVKLLKDLYKARIPVIVSNQRTTPDGMKYVLCWTGPDDWGNTRKLSSIFVEAMGSKGEYAVVRHFEGNSCFESRTWGFISEISTLAPDMKCVAKEATKLETEKTRLAVAGWLKQYPELKGIISSDDGDTITGIKQACDAAGRHDLVIVAAGHSKVGMDNIKSGFVKAINCQSAETDGALPVKLAADWFSGQEIEFINYLPKVIITADNVEDFYPAQW